MTQLTIQMPDEIYIKFQTDIQWEFIFAKVKIISNGGDMCRIKHIDSDFTYKDIYLQNAVRDLVGTESFADKKLLYKKNKEEKYVEMF